ncbi:MAG: hypothetical protein IPN13_00095 [Bacteroidetes bacterium]|nr:hypothetical protein [Bacteroidota bacterium]
MAKQLHSGQLKGIFIPDEAQDLLKSLLRQRAETAKQLRAIKSNIKALLLYHGMEVPKEFDSPNWSKAFIQWLMNIKWTHQNGIQGGPKKSGVTPRCKGLLRSYIIESAWVAFRLDPEMQTYYRKHIGRNPKSIIVKIARKLFE